MHMHEPSFHVILAKEGESIAQQEDRLNRHLLLHPPASSSEDDSENESSEYEEPIKGVLAVCNSTSCIDLVVVVGCKRKTPVPKKALTKTPKLLQSRVKKSIPVLGK
jgi:hypothetical protein